MRVRDRLSSRPFDVMAIHVDGHLSSSFAQAMHCAVRRKILHPIISPPERNHKPIPAALTQHAAARVRLGQVRR